MENNTKEVVIVCLNDFEDSKYDEKFILFKRDYEIIDNYLTQLNDYVEKEKNKKFPLISGISNEKAKIIKEVSLEYEKYNISYFTLLHHVFSLINISSGTFNITA